jgi:hypothetical protein
MLPSSGAALESLEHAVQYKEKYIPIFEQREREGLDPLGRTSITSSSGPPLSKQSTK